MKVTTLGAWLDAFKPLSTWTLIKAKLKSELGADATVLLPDECPDCGGSGEVRANDEERFTEDGSHREWTEDCPTCKGTGGKVWVVPKEQWEAGLRALLSQRCPGHHWDGEDTLFLRAAKEVMQRGLTAIATALLGGEVYRATEVGTLRIDTEGRAYVWNDVDGDQPIADHSTIAILEEEAHGEDTNA